MIHMIPESLNYFELGQNKVFLYSEHCNTVKHHILMIINLVFISVKTVIPRPSEKCNIKMILTFLLLFSMS